MGHSLSRRARTTVVAFVALAVLAVVPTSSPHAQARVPDGTMGKVAGMGVAPPVQPQAVTNAELPRIRRNGLNTASIDIWWDVDGATQSHVLPGSLTISDQALVATIRAARAQGLRVALTPKVWCPTCQRNWSGVLKPKNVGQFFRDYRSMVNRYAVIAQQQGVWLFFIGHEMNTLQGLGNEWREVARQTRLRYRGLITYDVDWSTFAGYAPAVTFWDTVDLASVSAYFPLSDVARPSVAELLAAWDSSHSAQFKGQRWYDKLAALAWTSGKKVLFAESGYLSSTHAAMRPYDPGSFQQTDQWAQVNAYHALLKRFDNVSWWAGTIWWEWGLESASAYTPRNKLAEQFLHGWYADGWRG
jgi:hypothetical protein